MFEERLTVIILKFVAVAIKRFWNNRPGPFPPSCDRPRQRNVPVCNRIGRFPRKNKRVCHLSPRSSICHLALYQLAAPLVPICSRIRESQGRESLVTPSHVIPMPSFYIRLGFASLVSRLPCQPPPLSRSAIAELASLRAVRNWAGGRLELRARSFRGCCDGRLRVRAVRDTEKSTF
jgi:hypothetical protein